MRIDGFELTDYEFWTLVASREIHPRDVSRSGEPPTLVELWREVVLAAWAVMMWRGVSRDPACGRVEWAERLVAGFARVGVEAHPDFRIESVTTASLGQKALRPLRAGMVSSRLATPTLISRADDAVFRAIAGL